MGSKKMITANSLVFGLVLTVGICQVDSWMLVSRSAIGKLNPMKSSSQLQSQRNNNAESEFTPFQRMKKQIKTLAALATISTLPFATPAWAGSVDNANNILSSYNLPPILYTPSGFSQLVSEYGRGNIREKMTNPILVQFAHPQTWIVQKTSVNNNGEAGTVSANDYIKGDSAFLYVAGRKDLGEAGKDPLSTTSKALIIAYIEKSLSQKGDPIESLKIYQIKEGVPGPDGQPYILVDFGYQLNTEAGFLIGRRAVLSLSSVGNTNNDAGGYLQGLTAVSTEKRWRQSNMESILTQVAESFRVYRLNSGLFSADS